MDSQRKPLMEKKIRKAKKKHPSECHKPKVKKHKHNNCTLCNRESNGHDTSWHFETNNFPADVSNNQIFFTTMTVKPLIILILILSLVWNTCYVWLRKGQKKTDIQPKTKEIMFDMWLS